MTLASSPDGVRWHRPRREPFLDLGPDGQWDDTWLNVTNNPPIRQGRHLRFWYMGRQSAHGRIHRIAAIGSFLLGVDRFVGLVAGRQTGQLVTEPVDARQPRLFINARLNQTGTVRVGLRTALAAPIAGRSAGGLRSYSGRRDRSSRELGAGTRVWSAFRARGCGCISR